MMIDKEEMLLRELAGGRCVIPKVTDELGPMSLWSKAGLEAEIRKAVEAEREACAKICEDMSGPIEIYNPNYTHYIDCAKAIRARGQE
jgi:hypothetical protein